MDVITSEGYCEALGGQVIEPRDPDILAKALDKAMELKLTFVVLGITDSAEEGE